MSSEGRLESEVLVPPGLPQRSLLVAVFERILAHRNPPVVLTRMSDGGPRIAGDHPAEAIVDTWNGFGTSFGVVAKGRGNRLFASLSHWAGHQGVFSFDWTIDGALADGFVDLLADISELVASPLAVISHRDVPGRRAWTNRQWEHMNDIRVAEPGAPYGLHRGLAGVPHRMVLGPELVAMFGEDRLASLPADLARRHPGGRWVLTPSTDLLAWTADARCPGEAAIVEALGPEHFYDPVTRALPTVFPDLPQVAPYPCQAKTPGIDEWVAYNGYTDEVPPAAGATTVPAKAPSARTTSTKLVSPLTGGDLPEEVLAALADCRDEVVELAASPDARIDGRNAADAMLRLADGAGVDEVARVTGQPAWRVRLWATRLAEIGMEAVEAGYWPAEPTGNDVAPFMVGLVFPDSPLTVDSIVSWARRSAWSENMGVDADGAEAWLVWPKCAYHFSISPDEADVAHVRTYYLDEVEVPAGVEVKALLTGVVGDMADPDVVNPGIDISMFLQESRGAVARFAGAR